MTQKLVYPASPKYFCTTKKIIVLLMPEQLHQQDISTFFVAGINYKKTDAVIRGRFAINTDQYAKLLQQAPAHHLEELFVISTCNRTEIYGFTENPEKLCQLLCTQTEGDMATFKNIAYIKNGKQAI